MFAFILYVLGVLFSLAVWTHMLNCPENLKQIDEKNLKSVVENKKAIKWILSLCWPIVAVLYWVL